METSDEIIFIVIIQSHECATHHNVFDLVYRVTQLLQLEKICMYMYMHKPDNKNTCMYKCIYMYMHDCFPSILHILPAITTLYYYMIWVNVSRLNMLMLNAHKRCSPSKRSAHTCTNVCLILHMLVNRVYTHVYISCRCECSLVGGEFC